MTNKRKYLFDDFTFDNYRHLLKVAKDKGFTFILHKDDYLQDRKDIIWRHDVEFEPDLALRMAEIEYDEGIISTFFFQLHSPYYNTLEPHYRDTFLKIKKMGHHVGLHFDSAYWGIEKEDQLNKYIKIDKGYFEDNLNVELDTFSFHNTTSFTQSCLNYKYGGLINVYSSFFKEHYDYCGDSLGYWRFDRLEDRLKDDKIRHLQVLTHDANWNDTVLSPRARFSLAMRNHAERVIKWHIDFLHQHGHLCPDDNED